MAYKYTKKKVFNGTLLKEPPLSKDNVAMMPALKHYQGYLQRRWLNNGCAVEEIGKFGYCDLTKDEVMFSALVWHLQDLLANPQPIANNDGIGPVGTVNGVSVFASRYVLAVLTDSQISHGFEDVLMNYIGFDRLAPYFGNTEKTYGHTSRIGLYGICCTRYLAAEHQR